MKARVAVIGSGAAGLSAAYELRDDAEVTLFEREPRPGGHANTITVNENGNEIGLDTGFIVFNGRTYPGLVAYFDELGVKTADHYGGFNFFDLDSGMQYGTDELGRPREEITARYPETFLNFWDEAQRFRRRGASDFRRGLTSMPLGTYLDECGFSEEFKNGYVILLASAVWSVPAELIWEMPASAVIGFFMGHGEAGLGGQEVEWKTVAGGSGTYVKRVLEEFGGDLRLGAEVTKVRELPSEVEVVTTETTERFDFCVVAAHADEALQLTDGPSTQAQQILSTVRYHPSVAVLHTDASLLPPDRERWQSWNYGRVLRDENVHTYIVWWLNHVHKLESETDYFVTLDPPRPISPDAVLREIPYRHPILTTEVRAAQKDIYTLNEGGRVKYCGSYFHSQDLGPDSTGYHEAAFVSGKEAGRSVRRELPRGHLAER